MLAIECKNINPPYSVRDSYTVHQRLFGDPTKTKFKDRFGEVGMAERREQFLKNNKLQVLNNLWSNLNINEEIKTIYLFVSKEMFWWTKYPPRETDIIFLRIDELDEFISSLIKPATKAQIHP